MYTCISNEFLYSQHGDKKRRARKPVLPVKRHGTISSYKKKQQRAQEQAKKPPKPGKVAGLKTTGLDENDDEVVIEKDPNDKRSKEYTRGDLKAMKPSLRKWHLDKLKAKEVCVCVCVFICLCILVSESEYLYVTCIVSNFPFPLSLTQNEQLVKDLQKEKEHTALEMKILTNELEELRRKYILVSVVCLCGLR